jgi:two-component system sensor histidine kinase DegS
MAEYKVDSKKIDKIVEKTIEAIRNGKKEIYDIADVARTDCEKLKAELEDVKKEVVVLIDKVEELEKEVKRSKHKLMLVNKNYKNVSEGKLKDAYEEADKLRIELAVSREREQNLIRRRNELEMRLKSSYKTLEKAENLASHVGVALEYLSTDLEKISNQLKDAKQKKLLGLRIIKAQEEERRRVASEVHDGPAQSMSNVVMKAELCEKLMDVDMKKTKTELRNLKMIVRNSLKEVRRILYNLRPMSLDDLGLTPTLQRFVEMIEEESGIAISLNTIGDLSNLDSALKITAFRLVQETLRNAVKHSKAKNVKIHLEKTFKSLVLAMADDGVGFDKEAVSNDDSMGENGYGLINMKEKVEILNGEFDLTTGIGKGTKIKIKIPLFNVEEDEVK